MTIKEHKIVVIGAALGTTTGFLLFSNSITSDDVRLLCLSVFSVTVVIASLRLEDNRDIYSSKKDLYSNVAFGIKQTLERLFWSKS